MMGDIVNLRRARKQKQRDEGAKAAAANREKFGRTKAERLTTKAEAQRSDKSLDGHKRDD
jgi:Domain of unknown function (DUF4169)